MSQSGKEAGGDTGVGVDKNTERHRKNVSWQENKQTNTQTKKKKTVKKESKSEKGTKRENASDRKNDKLL